MTLLDLARDIIDMRKRPLQTGAQQRYPAAAIQFAEAIDSCTDADLLRQIIQLDSGHVLPPPTKQQIYEKLLADDTTRTADVLRAFALHLVMFGYTAPDGTLVHDTDDRVDRLFAEADARS